MKKYLVAIILTLVALSFATACFANDGFQLDIDAEKMTVKASGTDTHIITDGEKKSFGITDQPLKQAIKNYFGKAPNDAYLHSKTPWGDLYASYHWPQVQTTVKAIRATMTHTAAEPQILTTGEVVNSTDRNGTVRVDLKQTVSNTQTHTWSHSDAITLSQNVSYNIGAAKGTSGISYTHQWGESKTNSQTVTVESDLGVTLELKPGDDFITELIATKSTLEVTVHYLASLSGDTAVNYNPTYKDHHFHAFAITNVMAKANLPSTKEITETITICNYSNAKIQLKEKKTGIVRHTLPVKIIHK